MTPDRPAGNQDAMHLDPIVQTARVAAAKAAIILRFYYENRPQIRKKGIKDLVTQADIESESAIIEVIQKRFPDHSILAEESGLSANTSENRWVIDPLDGTTNFAHGLPLFAVSIAFQHNGVTQLGMVANPISGETFRAVAGQGAYLNDNKIAVSDTSKMVDSLLVTGFPYDINANPGALLERFNRLLLAAQAVRRLGSAALDLCFVACGRFDGFWEERLKPWDTAAGELIAREAGARVTNFKNQPFGIDQLEIVATNAHIHSQLIDLLNEDATANQSLNG